MYPDAKAPATTGSTEATFQIALRRPDISFSCPISAVKPMPAAPINRKASTATKIPATSPVYEICENANTMNAIAVTGAKINRKPRSRKPSGFHVSRTRPKTNAKYAGMAVISLKIETCVAVACRPFFNMYDVCTSTR